MSNNKPKTENRKALPKFLLFLLICALIGGFAGYFSAKYGLEQLAPTIKGAAQTFGNYAAPWLLVLLAVLVPAVCIPMYKKAKEQLDAWDGEDEDVYEAADQKLSRVMQLAGSAYIISNLLIAAAYAGGKELFETPYTTVMFLVSIVAFVAVMVEMLILQQKCVDASKKVNPEKRGSVYDMQFQQKWMDSCDEAEKMMIGQCAIKAFGATNTACALIAGLLAVCALIFGTGFLPSLAVCGIWLINQHVYMQEAMKLSAHR